MPVTEIEPQRLDKMPERNPTNGTFELTVRCNLHCKMCMFRHDDSENPELMAKELTAAEWIDMARQAAEAGTMSLLITGGEPLLRPDFCEIWEGIYKQGFIMELYTNATLVTPKIMETLRKYPPHKIGVTIYGASSETYGKVCGNEEAFQKMLDGVYQLQTLPSVMEFRTTLIVDNFGDDEKIDELVSKKFGIEYVVIQACPVNKAVRGGCANVENYRISPEQDIKRKVERLVTSIRRIVGNRFSSGNLVFISDNNVAASENMQENRQTLFGCQAGMSKYTITYNGQLLACQIIGVFSTNAIKNGLLAAWESLLYEVQVPYEKGKCGSCEYMDSCRSCYGSRYAETGDFNGCSQYIYQTAKARKQYEIIAGGDYYEEC